MSVLFVVLPLAVVFSGLAVLAFLWATRHGQFDDLATPALRVLRDSGSGSERTSSSRTRESGSGANLLGHDPD
jgi:cbb3-type cytochrome oxidase maturation protein